MVAKDDQLQIFTITFFNTGINQRGVGLPVKTPDCQSGITGSTPVHPAIFYMDEDQTKTKAKIESELAKTRKDMQASLAKKRNGKKENVWDFVKKINELQEKLRTFQ